MKHQQFCEPQTIKLLRQLPRGITFAYDLHLDPSRDHCKDIAKEENKKK